MGSKSPVIDNEGVLKSSLSYAFSKCAVICDRIEDARITHRLGSERMLSVVQYIGILSIVCYVAITYDDLILDAPAGDEPFYIQTTRRLAAGDLTVLFREGRGPMHLAASHVSMLLLGDEVLATRMVSLISTIGVIIACMALGIRLGVRGPYVHTLLYLLLWASILSTLYYEAIADPLMHFFLVQFVVVLVWNASSRTLSSRDVMLAGAAIGCAALVRPIVVLHLPFLFAVLYYRVYRMGLWYSLRTSTMLIAVGLLVFALGQTPSLVLTGKISTESKSVDPSLTGGKTWSQLRYLDQLEYSAGRLEEGQTVGWEYLERYLEIHGDHSLPRTVWESMIWDPLLTAREGVRDFLLSATPPFFRHVTLLPVLFIVLMFIGYSGGLNEERRRAAVSLIVYYFGTAAVLSTVFIYYVEYRWLIAPLMLLLVVFPLTAQNAVKWRHLTNAALTLNVLLQLLLQVRMIIRMDWL